MPRHMTATAMGIIFGLIIHLYLLSTEGYVYSDLSGTGIILILIIGIILSYVILYLSTFLDQWISWKKNALPRLATGILLNFAILFLTLSIYYTSFWNIQLNIQSVDAPSQQMLLIKLAIIVLTMSAIFSIIYYALFSYHAYGIGRVNQAKFKKKLIDSQLETLQSQLTPHFLFNSLNTISSLIYKDVQKAEDFIRKLAKTYQYTLDNYNQQKITIKEEMDLVQSYVDMMKERFGKDIILKNHLSNNDMKQDILPLSLQTLIENAIKHNQILKDQTLTISISRKNGVIEVANNKLKSPRYISSNKIGLKNLDQRYQLANSKNVIVKDQDDSFVVQIPVI